MKLHIITRPHDFINVSADFILKICRDKNQGKKTRINIALSGGSTPKEIYESLAKKLSFMLNPGTDGPFKIALHFYQVDERYVPATNEDSNQKMIIEAFKFLTKKNFAHIHFHFFDTSLSIEKSLEKYSAELPKTFDLTILGIGEDGHTASLFPTSKALSTKSPVAHTTTNQFAIHDRLTLTFVPILKSKKLLVLLKNKPAILEKLQTAKATDLKSFTKFPALKLLKHKALEIYAFQAKLSP